MNSPPIFYRRPFQNGARHCHQHERPLACVKKEASTSFPTLERQQIELTKELIASLQPRPRSSLTSSPFQSPTPKLPKPTSRSPSTTASSTSSEPWHPISTDSPSRTRNSQTRNHCKPPPQYKYVKRKSACTPTLLSMQQDNIVKGLEALTSKAQTIVLGKSPSSTQTSVPTSSQSNQATAEPDSFNQSDPAEPQIVEASDAFSEVDLLPTTHIASEASVHSSPQLAQALNSLPHSPAALPTTPMLLPEPPAAILCPKSTGKSGK